jgi:hypothetical protein
MCLRSPVVPFAVLRGVTSTHTSLLAALPAAALRPQPANAAAKRLPGRPYVNAYTVAMHTAPPTQLPIVAGSRFFLRAGQQHTPTPLCACVHVQASTAPRAQGLCLMPAHSR